ncbi:MAG: DsbA family protein [Roseinatronobacter sp.]
MKKFILSALVLAAVAGGGWWYVTQQQATPEPLAATFTPSTVDGIQPLDMPLGNPDAPVVVIEYSSLTCPHCANFHRNVFPRIREEFIDTDRILFLKREVFFDRFGLWAAMVARCGGEERFHGIVELVYQTQAQWTASNDPAVIAENLRRLGRQAGMSDPELNACMEDEQKALDLMAFYQANAEAHNIRATPSFIINGQPYSNMPWPEFERLLNEKLGD